MFTTQKNDVSPVWNKAAAAVPKLPPHYPVLSAKDLLKGPSCTQILTQIKNLAFVPDALFKNLYLKAIYNYAEFVQGLPAVYVDNFNYHGGLLELGLKRALNTLAWYRREHPLRGVTVDQVPTRQAIWSYALFSAGLVYGLGQVAATYWVMLCEKDGAAIQRWNPVKSKMAEQGPFYRYSYEKIRRDELAARGTVVAALEVLPKIGVSWIATDAEIYNAWLSILLNDDTHAGLFAKYVLPTQADLEQQINSEPGCIIGTEIDEYTANNLIQDKTKTAISPDKTESPSLFTTPSPEDALPGNNEGLIQNGNITGTGIIFIQWLVHSVREQQRLGQKNFNLSVTSDGLLIDRALVKLFVEQNKQLNLSAEKAWAALSKEIGLGIGRIQASSFKEAAAVILADVTVFMRKISINRDLNVLTTQTQYPDLNSTANANNNLSLGMRPGR